MNGVFIEVGRKMDSKCTYGTLRNYFGRVTYFERYVAFLFKIHLLLLFLHENLKCMPFVSSRIIHVFYCVP